MKKTALLILVTAVACLSSMGCAASARIDIPRGSINKPSQDVQVAFVTKAAAETR